MKRLICVYTESIIHHKTLLQSLDKDPRLVQLFNTDLSRVQQYLFTKLKIEPTSKVEVQYDKNESRRRHKPLFKTNVLALSGS
jgi:hypothetical protein